MRLVSWVCMCKLRVKDDRIWGDLPCSTRLSVSPANKLQKRCGGPARHVVGEFVWRSPIKSSINPIVSMGPLLDGFSLTRQFTLSARFRLMRRRCASHAPSKIRKRMSVLWERTQRINLTNTRRERTRPTSWSREREMTRSTIQGKRGAITDACRGFGQTLIKPNRKCESGVVAQDVVWWLCGSGCGAEALSVRCDGHPSSRGRSPASLYSLEPARKSDTTPSSLKHESQLYRLPAAPGVEPLVIQPVCSAPTL